MATTDTTAVSLTEYKVAMFEELGFSFEDAMRLTECYRYVTVKDIKGMRKSYEQRVDYHYVRKMLDGGASREQVIDLLTHHEDR